MALFSLVALAFAGPTRCVATFTPPPTGCALRGPITLTSAAPSEAGAKRAVLSALRNAVDKAGGALIMANSNFGGSDIAGCGPAADAAFPECFPEPALSAVQYCFVTLADTACWSGDVLELEDKGWKVFDASRAQMCAAVDAAIVAKNYPDVTLRRAQCEASCLAATVVRCPS